MIYNYAVPTHYEFNLNLIEFLIKSYSKTYCRLTEIYLLQKQYYLVLTFCLFDSIYLLKVLLTYLPTHDVCRPHQLGCFFIFSKICTPLLLVIFPCIGRFYCSVHQQRSVILICITKKYSDQLSTTALVRRNATKNLENICFILN